MATFGRFSDFNKDKEEWRHYAERMQQIFVVNNIENSGSYRKHTIFLSGVGAHTYTLLRSLVHPAKLGEKRRLLGISALRWRPISIQIKPSITVHRFKFNSHTHQPGESVATFVAARIVPVGRTLPVWWRFEWYVTRYRLVVDMQDKRIQRSLH